MCFEEMSLEYTTTVIIAAYNSERTIERAIRSALEQGPSTEVIVVDDHSTDDTYEISTALVSNFEHLKVFQLNSNQGPSAARNRALKESSGLWVTPLDADDFMKPGRLSQLLDHANRHQLDIVADDILKVHESNPSGQETRLWSEENFGSIRLSLVDFVLGNMTGQGRERSELGFLKPIVRRSFLEAHNITYKPEMRLGEDYILYCEALIAGAKFDLIDPAGYVAVVRESSLSGSHKTHDLRCLFDAEANILKIASLTRDERNAFRKHNRQVQNEWAWRHLIDAVKARDIAEILLCFCQSLNTSVSLVAKLSQQMLLRSRRYIMSSKTERLSQRPMES